MTSPNQLNDFELLSAYLDNALTASARADLEARLDAEPDLRTELAQLRDTLRLLRSAPVVKPPRSFTLDPARYQRPVPWWARFQAMQTIGALGTAAAVILIALGLFTSTASYAPSSAGVASGVVAILPTATSLSGTFGASDRRDLVTPTLSDLDKSTTGSGSTSTSVPSNAAQEAAPLSDQLTLQSTAPGSASNFAAAPTQATMPTMTIVAAMPTNVIQLTATPLQAAGKGGEASGSGKGAADSNSQNVPGASPGSSSGGGGPQAQSQALSGPSQPSSGAAAPFSSGAAGSADTVEPSLAGAPGTSTAQGSRKADRSTSTVQAPQALAPTVPLPTQGRTQFAPSPTATATALPTQTLPSTVAPAIAVQPTNAEVVATQVGQLRQSATATLTQSPSLKDGQGGNEIHEISTSTFVLVPISTILLIVGFALLVFSVMLFSIGWMRSRQ